MIGVRRERVSSQTLHCSLCCCKARGFAWSPGLFLVDGHSPHPEGIDHPQDSDFGRPADAGPRRLFLLAGAGWELENPDGMQHCAMQC